MPAVSELLLVATVVLTVFSPMTGSFLQCWADRARQGDTGAPDGRSYCDSCGKTLSAIDLVPVLSWLWNRGRARCCGAPLHPTLLYSEVAVGLLALWGVLVVPLSLALPTILLAWGLQAVVLLTGPDPKAARGFAGALTVLGLASAFWVDGGASVAPFGAALLGLALAIGGRMVWRGSSDALLLLAPAGAFTGFAGLALVGFLAIPAAVGVRYVKPLLYPQDRRRPVMPGEAIVFGLAAALWVVWLYVRK